MNKESSENQVFLIIPKPHTSDFLTKSMETPVKYQNSEYNQ